MASEIKRRFTDTEIQIARKTDLPELLTHLGYQVKRIGRYHTTAEMDSLRIKDRRTWFRYSQNTGGGAITLVQQFCGKTFPEAVEYLLVFNGRARDSPAQVVSSIKQDTPPKPFALPPRNTDDRRVFAYLRKRGIAPQVIRQFLNSGLLYEDDDMDLYTLGERKCALYAVIPDNDTTFNFLVSLLYSQIFQTLYYCADQIHHRALPCHVHFILDEAPSVNLPGLPRELATMRSRNISCSTIIQNMAQIKELYKDSWETIPGNSDTLLYLGGNEASTHKYISEALGKSTIDTKTHGQTKGRSGSYSTNFQMSGRKLLTPDEVRMLDNRYCILFIRGARPVMDLKYELMDHPAIRQTVDGGAPPYIHHGTATPTLPGEPLFRFDQNDEKENIA